MKTKAIKQLKEKKKKLIRAKETMKESGISKGRIAYKISTMKTKATKQPKEKKTKQIKAKSTCEFWGTTEGRLATELKSYYRNGEFHSKGFWNDTKESFELPSVFFEDAE